MSVWIIYDKSYNRLNSLYNSHGIYISPFIIFSLGRSMGYMRTISAKNIYGVKTIATSRAY